MPRPSSTPIAEDHGWLITPRALTSVATIVGLVYTLHAPVRYVLAVGANVDALSARVASLETEIDQQRTTIDAELVLLQRQQSVWRESAREGPPVPQPKIRPTVAR